MKTTDAYRISLDTISGYRDRLVVGEIINGKSSILMWWGEMTLESLRLRSADLAMHGT